MDLTYPDQVQGKSFEDFFSLLIYHFEASTNVIVERFKFHSIKQTEFLAAKDVVVKLKKQATKCKY